MLVVIDKEGKVGEVKVLSGDPLLTGAAVDAMKQWKYRPYLLNGEPVEVQTAVRFKFHM